MPSKPRMDILPVLALLSAAFFWGILWYPLRWLAEHGLPGLWASGMLFASALLPGLPLLWRHRGQMLSQPGLLSGLMLASGWCNTAFILAVLDGQVVRVMLLFYLSPVWAVLLARIMLGERLPPRAMVTLSLAMSGALIILWQPSLGVPWPRGHADWLAISSGLAFAFSNVLIRKAQDLSVAFKALVSWAGVVMLSGVLVMAGMSGAPVWNIAAVAVAVGLGIGGITLMSAGLVYGVTNMPVHRSTVILLFEVLVGAVSAQWWAGEVLGWREWFGGVLILAAAWFASRRQLQD